MSFPVYGPEFDIQINGEPMPAEVRAVVSGIQYQDGQNAADRVEVTIGNPDLRWLQRHIRGLGVQPFPTGVRVGPVRVADAAPDGTFDIDNSFSLAIGYAPGPLETMFEGELTGVEASFPNGGMPTMKVVAHDKLHRLSLGTKARGFGLLPDFLIAALMSAENLLIPVIDPAVAAASSALAVVQAIFSGSGRKQGGQFSGESNLDLMKRIAKSYDADFWVEGDFLYLSRFVKEYSPRLTLTWGESLMEFSPRMSAVGQVAGVSVKFTLREVPLSFRVTVFWDFDRESLGISIMPGAAGLAVPGFGGASFSIINRAIASPADVAASALAIISELRCRLNHRVTGSGSAIGDPRIRAGAVIRLEGLGPDFSGDYRVTSATHTVDGSGYVTNFEVAKEIIP